MPWNARYSFPSQSNKAEKLTPRIPPKNGSNFAPGQVIRVEFPAQGYVNPLNTTFEFDLTLHPSSTASQTVRVQNNIQSVFSRVRLLYGATPLEDVINYNHIVRALTEWTATNQNGVMDQTSIKEGIGGYVVDTDGTTSGLAGGALASVKSGIVNVRQKFIHGISNTTAAGSAANFTGGTGLGSTGDVNSASAMNVAGAVTRRYQVNFALGLFTQDKLIPVKFMASQLAIEITLEQPQACLFCPSTNVATAVSNVIATQNLGWVTSPLTVAPTYSVGNVNLIPEILQFDASYGNFVILYRRNVFERFKRRWSSIEIFIMAYIYIFIIKRSKC